MSKETFMIEALTREIIVMLMQEKSLSMREAMDAFYSSKTFNSLSNQETGLYFQSPAYIFDEFEREKRNN